MTLATPVQPLAAPPPPALPELAQLRGARQRGSTPIQLLAELRGLPEREAAGLLAAAFSMPFLDSRDLARCAPRFDRLSLPQAQQRHAVLLQFDLPAPGEPGLTGSNAAPLQADRHRAVRPGLVCALSNPFDGDLITQIEHLAGEPVRIALATEADLRAYLGQHEGSLRAMDAMRQDGDDNPAGAGVIETLSLASVSDSGSQAVRLVGSTLYDALRSGASDVHLESTPSGLAVKYRIDGVLDAITQVNGTTLAEQVISRLKVLAELDIAERRVPQDGSFRVLAQGRQIDLRVSIMPSVHGEDAVVRILDKQAVIQAHGKLTLDALGFDAVSLQALRAMLALPHGMLLVTGPTGSGKTTTLYAALSETFTGREKIVTIEDPVEYQLPGVLQIPVNEKKGLTFARSLRSILRHDPDKIMVGEIRDRETAEIAVQSALTGHLVLTTVHANNVFDVFGRFTHRGLDPFALVSALNGIWAQRLLRTNCPHCSQPCVADPQELSRLRLDPAALQGATLRRGLGCGDCRGTGYKGRRAVAEVLQLDDEIRELIVDRQPIRRIKEAARRHGTRSLAESALDLVLGGHTTLEEMRRVTAAV